MEERTAPEEHLAFIGFGEAAMAFLTGWGRGRPARVSAYDVKSAEAGSRAEIAQRYHSLNVDGAAEPAVALAGATVVFCVVTAGQALAAAREAAPHLAPGALWLDCNSCAPETKRRAAEVIDAAGGRYADVAVMAPVHPKKHHVPILLSGPHAAAAAAVLRALDMKPQTAGADIGQASSIKMLRSIMIKGMEALTAECFLAARRAGVEEAVIASLDASDPGTNWRGRGAYNLERMRVHGARRAAEMREVVVTVEDLGLAGRMSAAAAAWQEEIAALGADPDGDDLAARCDALLSRL